VNIDHHHQFIIIIIYSLKSTEQEENWRFFAHKKTKNKHTRYKNNYD